MAQNKACEAAQKSKSKGPPVVPNEPQAPLSPGPEQTPPPSSKPTPTPQPSGPVTSEPIASVSERDQPQTTLPGVKQFQSSDTCNKPTSCSTSTFVSELDC